MTGCGRLLRSFSGVVMMKLVSLISVASVLLVGLTLQPTLVRAEEPVAAAVAATTDVEATMKKIGFNFKQAMQAT